MAIRSACRSLTRKVTGVADEHWRMRSVTQLDGSSSVVWRTLSRLCLAVGWEIVPRARARGRGPGRWPFSAAITHRQPFLVLLPGPGGGPGRRPLSGYTSHIRPSVPSCSLAGG